MQTKDNIVFNTTTGKMKRTSVFALTAVLLAMTFAGCSSDNDYTSGLTPDCAITAVTIGTLYRNYQTTLDDGRDTSYVITLPGSTYPMHIDQLRREIYNTDSLPLGTMVNKVVLTTLTADGTVLLRNENGTDTLYSTKDTLDFTTPRIFTVYSSDGTGSRMYTIRINVHQADPEAYTWIAAGDANLDIAAMSGIKTQVSDGIIYLWGRKDGKTVFMTRPDADNAAWTYSETTGADGTDLQSIIKFNGTFFATGTDGLMKSTDGKTWEPVSANITPTHLLGASKHEIYAATATGAYGSQDGTTWTPEETDAPATLLPQTNVITTTQPSKTNPNIENVIAMGYIGTDFVVWKKEIDLTGIENNPWSYYPYTEENPKSLPYMQGVSLIKYGDELFAAGILEGKPSIFISSDGARTWLTPDTKTILPANIGEPEEISLTAGNDNTIWIVCTGTGQLWRGYLNRLKAGASL